MKSTIIIRLMVIICICNCACWTTALAIEPPSHQKQQIIELLLEEERQFFKLPWKVLDQLQQLSTLPPPPSQSPSPLPASSPTLPPTSSPPLPPLPPASSPSPPSTSTPPPPPPTSSPPPPPTSSPSPPPTSSPPAPPPQSPPPHPSPPPTSSPPPSPSSSPPPPPTSSPSPLPSPTSSPPPPPPPPPTSSPSPPPTSSPPPSPSSSPPPPPTSSPSPLPPPTSSPPPPPPPPTISPSPPPSGSPPPPPTSFPPPPPSSSPPPPPQQSPPPPPPPELQPPPPALAPPPPEVNYPIVTFDLLGANALTYKKFILEMRDNLKGPNDLAKFGIPMLRDPDTITNFDRFLLVQLLSGRKPSTMLALRVSDGNLVGYCCSYDPITHYTAWFFDDTTDDEKALLFKGENVKHQSLGFKGNYDSLGSRNDISLGPLSLEFSIATLSRTRFGEDMTEVKNSLLVIVQMVSEAARFQYIAGPVVSAMDNYYYPYIPDALARSYENNWETLSKEVANGFGLGTLRNPVALKDENGLILKIVWTVWQIRDELSMLAFVKTYRSTYS